MKSLGLSQERGQALVVVALAAVVLFGFAALAIDGTAKLSDRRHAQNAADTAVLAAALAKVNAQTAGLSDTPATCPPTSGSPSAVCSALQLAGLDRASSNSYNNDLTTNTVEVYSPPISGYYAGKTEYVQVIITSHVKTYFMRVLGVAQTDNVVQAVALTKKGGPLFNGASIVSLNPDTSSGCSGTMRVGGSATITLNGGGMFINSDESDCALEQQGGCPNSGDPLLVINGGGISSAGNGNVDFDSCMDPYLPTITYNQQQVVVPDEVYMPDVPVECSTAGYATSGGSVLHPGYYTSFPPVSNKDVVLVSGVYCLKNGFSWSGTNFKSLDGTSGVTFYIPAGNGFSININKPIDLVASNSGDYAGFLIIMDGTQSSIQTCTINGGSDINLNGTIFAPYCDITINGNNSSISEFNAQVIGWNVKLNGNNTIDFTYDPADNAENRRRVGLMK
jgi:hypothetical protein